MGTYGRNFWFLQSPEPESRLGRYNVGATGVLIGAPVVASATVDANGQRAVSLCTGATVPKKGKHGIIIWEAPSAYLPGLDPMLYRGSDLDTTPPYVDVQLVVGEEVRFRLVNTVSTVLQHERTYAARTMVAGLGATPTLSVDDYIGPGTGNDTAGYWAETDAAHAWAVVTAVYDTGEIDAHMVAF